MAGSKDPKKRQRQRRWAIAAGTVVLSLLLAAGAGAAILSRKGTLQLGRYTLACEVRYDPVFAPDRAWFLEPAYRESPASVGGFRVGPRVYLLSCYQEAELDAWEEQLDREIDAASRQGSGVLVRTGEGKPVTFRDSQGSRSDTPAPGPLFVRSSTPAERQIP